MKVVIIGNGIAGNQVAFQTPKKNGRISDISSCPAKPTPSTTRALCPISFPAGTVCIGLQKVASDYEKTILSWCWAAKCLQSTRTKKSVASAEWPRNSLMTSLFWPMAGEFSCRPIEGIDKQGVFSLKNWQKQKNSTHHKGRPGGCHRFRRHRYRSRGGPEKKRL